ncbi:hypothetical protein PHMEG_00038135 [Phytophthora megakarya]|uniref:Avirulence (Avh) protein n=1 Tax=Phytophthora megakarya TaxID=4795 RepID=A0A225UIA1_9STRA|nr:hypothetical protein PHMEG_00038135 [Phytophthora megakarya]
MLYDWQTPETAFTFLKLNNGDNPLAKPELKEWIKYMNAFNDRIIGNPTVTKTTLIDMLMKNYDDQALYTIIATAKQSADSNMMAKYIESELISNWLVSGRPLAFISKTLGKTREEKSHVQKLYLKKIKKLEKDM